MGDDVVVDDREFKVIEILKRLGVEPKVERLEIGDIVYPAKGICIERKTISDFSNSTRSRHIYNQVYRMSLRYPRNYLLISGSLKTLVFKGFSKWTVEKHLGALSSLAVRFENLRILMIDNDNQLVKLVLKIIEKTDDGKIPEIEERMLLPSTTPFVNMLCCIPGIGLKKADRIFEKYKSFPSFYNALNAGTLEVEGIGDKLIQNIKQGFS